MKGMDGWAKLLGKTGTAVPDCDPQWLIDSYFERNEAEGDDEDHSPRDIKRSLRPFHR